MPASTPWDPAVPEPAPPRTTSAEHVDTAIQQLDRRLIAAKAELGRLEELRKAVDAMEAERAILTNALGELSPLVRTAAG
ncbi:MAG: hypothetical protein NVS9B4_01220 [Candidatus Acidiferrum sp.]